MNHLRFNYRMVLICPKCAGCGLNSWRTIEAHIKACAKSRSNVASHKADPGQPVWWRSDNQLKCLTRALETAATFKLPTWAIPPDDANQEDRGSLINKTLSEMQEQPKALKEEADRAAKAKMSTRHKKAEDTDQNNTVNDKESKPRSKWQTRRDKDKQRTLAAKSIDLTSDDLDGHFSAFLDKCSQETASTTQEDSQPEPPK